MLISLNSTNLPVFTPECGHCKALAPEYEEAAATLKKKDIKLVKIDCTEQAVLCEAHDVKRYPDLKVFRGLNNVSPYSGPREATGIVSYMITQSLPAVSILEKDTVESFKSMEKVVIIAYIDAKDTASTNVFTAVADQHRHEYLFGSVSDTAIAERDGVKAPAVLVYKIDEGKSHFHGKFDAELITEFVKTSAAPLIGEIGHETFDGFMSAGLPLAYVFAETEKERAQLTRTLRPIANKFKGKVNFGTIDASVFGIVAENLNLKADTFPAFVIQDIKDNLKFPFDQAKEITQESIAEFVEDYVNGRIEPNIKSEPIPESQDGPVTVVVAKNYDDIVFDDNKDVLVEFYAPWCGHCQALAPKYDQLGDAFRDFRDKITIAKVDVTLNDVPDKIPSFPTIKLFPAGDKQRPVTYDGDRSVKDLAAFIKDNGKHKAEVFIPADEVTGRTVSGDSQEKEATPRIKTPQGSHDEL